MGPTFQGLLSALCGTRYPLVGPDSLQTYFSCHNWIENCGLGNSRLLAQVSQLSTGSVKTASALFSDLGGGTMAKRPALLCCPLVALVPFWVREGLLTFLSNSLKLAKSLLKSTLHSRKTLALVHGFPETPASLSNSPERSWVYLFPQGFSPLHLLLGSLFPGCMAG